ncbi:peptidase T [Vagococcus penaei]|uniref:Peptidase T n=1 Tax=Vagococcus penaei TaxID=633807 RepID=A0A1Q2D3P0_9ENTE|nr:peptidase T [Vagococcus penaei]AQP52951.1 peptidase T [Vagococcus penaei]RSU02590.1 peptidase T [Vagococcus penaei]
MYKNLVNRFLGYVKTETRSDAASQTTPSTPTQVAFAKELEKELTTIGMSDVFYNEKNGFVIATLPSNVKHDVRSIGFIAHMDTADFNAKNVQPQIIENYDGQSTIPLGKDGKYELSVAEFPNLTNYVGQTLITTDGQTLLGSDDKSGIAEIMTAMEHLIAHPEIKHGKIMVAFGPDEEIGVGADKFEVSEFPVDFAYTMDGGPVGELQYETFNAAQAELKIEGKNVHPGTAKDTMINALQVGIDFHNQLPSEEVPEKTDERQGFYHLYHFTGVPDAAEMTYIIRDHHRESFENRKQKLVEIAKKMNAEFGQDRLVLEITDQYYNMREVIEKDMSIIELVKEAMLNLGIEPIIEPVRGGTDGSKISFMGLPTPNIFAGGENMHGRFEFVAVESMEKATSLIVEIARLNTQK